MQQKKFALIVCFITLSEHISQIIIIYSGLLNIISHSKLSFHIKQLLSENVNNPQVRKKYG